jgi:hypothetical protein
VAVARVRKAAGFAQWLNAAETELGVPLMAALTAPLNHLDIAVSGESLLSILKPPGIVTETAACSDVLQNRAALASIACSLRHAAPSPAGLTALRNSVPASLVQLRDEVARCAAGAVEAVGMLRYRRRDCLALARLVNLARQFSGPLAGDLVRPHRRLIKSSKLRTMQAPPHLAAHDRWSGADSLLFFLFSDILVGAMVCHPIPCSTFLWRSACCGSLPNE